MTATAVRKRKSKTLPPRNKVKEADTWDLASLYPDDEAWETAFVKWEKQIKKYAKYQGTLGDSAAQLAACLAFDNKFDRLAERLGTYAFLKTTEDTANSDYQRMMGRYQHAASEASQAASFMRPEILAIPSSKFKKFLVAKELKPYQLMLDRLVRYKPHTLSDAEERLLAMQGQMSDTSNQTFRQLTDADFKFGMIKNEQGETIELSHSSFSALLHSPKRAVRKAAFHQYYDVFEAHENTLASTLSGSVQRDVYYAKARGYDSALGQALFDDNVPQCVYDNLIQAVRSRQPASASIWEIRRRKMRLKAVHHYDTYVPILSDLDQKSELEASGQSGRRVVRASRQLVLRSVGGGIER